MNIEIANRLVSLRKSNHLSQEALAEKLGISRQAVSKWERAEASPDTDNLILLSRLYHVSLDELLKTEEEILPERGEESKEPGNASEGVGNGGAEEGERLKWQARKDDKAGSQEEEAVETGFGGVHVRDRDGSEVHIDLDGIHVDESQKEENVYADKKDVYADGEKHWDWEWIVGRNIPFAPLISVIYLVAGLIFDAWHPGWLLFLLIPLWYSLASAVKNENANYFAYPVLVTLVYLCGGFFFTWWHPGWILYLTIPIYYSFVANRRKRS